MLLKWQAHRAVDDQDEQDGTKTYDSNDSWHAARRSSRLRKWRAAPFPRSSRARLDWAVHYLSLPWKLLFACIPPTLFFGGKATFVVALVCIGAVTAIGDVAALFGCVLGMPDAITANTVALGTSLPDTFLGLRAKPAAVPSRREPS